MERLIQFSCTASANNIASLRMFKSMFFLVLCTLVLIECAPSEMEHSTKTHERVVRQSGIPNPVETGINVASQMAQKAAETAQRAIEIGKKVMHGMAQGAMGTVTQNPGA